MSVGVGWLGTYPNGDIDVEEGIPLPRTNLSSQFSLWHLDAGVPYEVSLSTMPVKNIDEGLPFLTCRLADLVTAFLQDPNPIWRSLAEKNRAKNQ